MAAPVRDSNNNVVEEGDVISCRHKKRPKEVVTFYVKHHTGLGCLVACNDEKSQFHHKTLKGISDEYHITVIDEHQHLYM